jgi:hypothetical protein
LPFPMEPRKSQGQIYHPWLQTVTFKTMSIGYNIDVVFRIFHFYQRVRVGVCRCGSFCTSGIPWCCVVFRTNFYSKSVGATTLECIGSLLCRDRRVDERDER